MAMAGGVSSPGDLISVLDDACGSGRMISGALALISNGRVTLVSTAGNLYEGGPEVGVATLFGLGSIAELLTAIAVARSQTMQHSAWVSDYVPSARLGRTTVEQLLSHTSGLPYARRDHGPTDLEALRRFIEEDAVQHQRRTAPGELAWPSASGYAVAGRAMEVLGSAPFDDVLRKTVLDPAGMSLAVTPDGADPNSVAWPHESRGSDMVRADQLNDDTSGHAAGFLFASLQDLVSLATGIIEGYLVDTATWERMARRHVSRHVSHVPYPLALTATGHGLGCLTGEWNGQPVVRRPGHHASYRCTVEILPESSSAVVLLTNGADSRTFNDLVVSGYEALGGRGRLGSEPTLEPMDPTLIEAWKGTYVQPASGKIVRVSDRDDDLFFDESGAELPLYNVGRGRAVVPLHSGSAPLWFPVSEGPASYVTVWGEPYYRETPAPWAPDDPTAFEGVYRDAFFPVDATDLTFQFNEGTWSVTRDGKRVQATQLTERKLVSRFGTAHFSEDGSSVQIGDATVYRRS